MLKSKRDGEVDVVVKEKIPWPHEAILGVLVGRKSRSIKCPLTQFVQGFSRNILENKMKQ